MGSIWPFHSIRSRLTLWYALLFLIAMLLLGAGTAWWIEQELREDVDLRLEETALAMRKQVEQAFIENRPQVYLPPDAFTFPSQLVQVVDNLGRIQFASENLGTRRLPLDQDILDTGDRYDDTVIVDGVTIRVHVEPIQVDDQLLGAVIAGQPMLQLSQTLQDLRRTFIIAAIAGSIVAAFGGWFISRRAFRPVDRMTRTARRIASPSADALPLTTRLEVPATSDEIARLGETINSLLDRLQESIELQRRFVADASHELRTPLTAVQGNVDLLERQLQRRGDDTPETTETIDDLRRESRRMTRLVADLLTLARFDAGVASTMVMRSVPVMSIIANAIRTATAMHPATPFGVDHELVTTLPGDQEQLEQVLVILLDNAALHSQPGAPVSVHAQRRNDWIEIAVADKGSGIPADDIPHVFERFYRADASRSSRRGGSGLGLPIALAIVNAHGGSIGVESVPGHGTVMTVRLPAHLSAAVSD